MLFRKEIDPMCVYCSHGTPHSDDYILCRKYGVVRPGYSCRKFSYDPLKRVPPRPASPKEHIDDDRFSID